MPLQVKKNRKYAFTLAEVLITLGIIGVVASLTIPTLMTEIEDMQFKNGAKKAFSTASQAIQKMKEDEGGTLKYYSDTRKSFKPVFINYFNIIKDCGWDDCISGGALSNTYKTLTNDPAEGWRVDEGQFITADGMFWAIENEGTASVQPRILITVDVNGYTKKPNTYGKDVFMFQLLNDNLVPMGGKDTYIKAPTYCNRTTNNTWSGFGCMVYVMQSIDY